MFDKCKGCECFETCPTVCQPGSILCMSKRMGSKQTKAQQMRAAKHMVENWIPTSYRYPDNNDFVLVSFENESLLNIAIYREDKEGGTFYPLNNQKSYASIGLFVNAWMSLPEPYRKE